MSKSNKDRLLNITLHNLGRRFDQEWVFRNMDYTFSSTKKYAILGPNGSGKSTLLKMIAGQLTPSEGSIRYCTKDDQEIHVEDVYRYLSFAAPYIELIEEFTLEEMLDFHFRFKSFREGFDKSAVLSFLAMERSVNKPIRHFSSGMKQRVKLTLSCFSKADILLLDEPASNLDVEGEKWYRELISLTCTSDRLLFIGSNQEKEYSFCDESIQILDYK